MPSNYPPGVTGMEPEIYGYPDETDTELEIDNLKKEIERLGALYEAYDQACVDTKTRIEELEDKIREIKQN